MDNDLYVYDQIMLGNRKSFGKGFFEKHRGGPSPSNEVRALKIIKYAVEQYLDWTPEKAHACFDEDTAEEISVGPIIHRQIPFPTELEPQEYMGYIVSRLYQESYPYQEEEHIINYYKKVLSGKIPSFKKGFFTGNAGNRRARACLRYVLEQQCPERFSDTQAAYRQFTESAGNKLLKEYGLSSACRDQFEFALDYLHYSLRPKERDRALYLRLRQELIEKKAMRKKQSVKVRQEEGI